MISEAEFERARKELEVFLNRELSETRDKQNKLVTKEYESIESGKILMLEEDRKEFTKERVRDMLRESNELTLVRTSSPEVIGKGTHQMAIALDSGLIAKLPYRDIEQLDNTFQINRKYPYLQETRNELVRLGFNIPDMHFYVAKHYSNGLVVSPEVIHEEWRDQFRLINKENRENILGIKDWPNACITSDLREEGRYRVVEYDEEVIKYLVNGDEVSNEFDKSYDLLRNLPNSQQDELYVNGQTFFGYEYHKIGSADEAIRKMFLLQVPVDKKEKGKLVIGDIDHVYLFR